MKYFIFSTIFICLLALSIQTSTAQMMGHWGDDGIGHNDRHFMDWPDSAEVITVSGTVIVDSDYPMMPHYYLDTNSNSESDYMLGFGPWWYEPESGAQRPVNGQKIEIKGWVHEQYEFTTFQMLAVIEIDGLKWREEDSAPPWSGNWIHSNDDDDGQFVFCPTDSSSWLEFRRGGMMGGGHGGGMMFPDSIFVQFELMHPDSLPGFPDSTCIAGFHVNMADDTWSNMMGYGKHSMGFRQGVNHRFHFTQEMVDGRGIHNFTDIELRYFDPEYGWQSCASASYFPHEMNIDYSSETVYDYYGLFAVGFETSINENSGKTLSNFSLEQNYPNPYNPTTSISYRVPKSSFVILNVYNSSGQLVEQLENAEKSAGNYTVNFNAQSLPSGIYLYQIKAGHYSDTKTMLLLK